MEGLELRSTFPCAPSRSRAGPQSIQDATVYHIARFVAMFRSRVLRLIGASKVEKRGKRRQREGWRSGCGALHRRALSENQFGMGCQLEEDGAPKGIPYSATHNVG